METAKTQRRGTIRRRFEGDHVRFESDRGALIVPRELGDVFHYRAVGHYDAAMVEQIWASFDAFAAMRTGRQHAFADFSEVTGYDTEARQLGAAGFRERMARWDTFHVLLPRGVVAKLLSMAFSMIALVSRVPMECYTDPRLFEAERARRAARR
ncbi:MAG: hypothetical protein K8H88_31060 [Sandaracinaceae bacterium]|nr:hypothetical protein [Sandaracinaceae bacterium]